VLQRSGLERTDGFSENGGAPVSLVSGVAEPAADLGHLNVIFMAKFTKPA
jgi:hypothetical protein